MTDNWHHCYNQQWNGHIVPEAMSHPAKFSRGLIERIYQHALAEGWLKAGDSVIDPFSGVGLGALYAMKHGLNWYGVELEPRFVALAQQNIERWNAQYRRLPHWGTARVLQGDSRELVRLVGEAGACVSSPPYTDFTHSDNGFIAPHDTTQLMANVDGYGHTPGNLGNLPAGDYDAAIASPPWNETGTDIGTIHHNSQVVRRDGKTFAEYGTHPGQLGAMPAGGFEASVSSPPYDHNPGASDNLGGNHNREVRDNPRHPGEKLYFTDYAKPETAAMLGGIDAFWPAARVIVAQVYTVLRPGACAIWVTKRYVRDKRIVEFSQQWAALCEAVGFELVHWHRAWLVEERGTQATIDNGLEKRSAAHKSFFRRQYEAKAQAAKYWPLVDRTERSRHLWESHRDLWARYHRDSLRADPDLKRIMKVTPRGILSAAQTQAWKAAGQPRMDIDTRIDWEDVLCMRKPVQP